MIMQKFISTFCLVISLSTLTQISLAQATKAAQIETYLEPFVKAGQFSGVILAAENGRVIYEKAFGLANADFQISNRSNTRIGIASLTKMMTIVIACRMVEAGKISLSDNLNKYLPAFPNGDKITIEMLMTHRSGIPHKILKNEEETLSLTTQELLAKIRSAPLAFPPGSQRLYSSSGFTVLARTLEIASGKAYAQLLEEYVFTPAGMKDSVDFDSKKIIERRAQDYLLTPTGYINAPYKDYSFLVGAGSVFSTAGDIYKFGQAVLEGKFGETVKTYLIGKTAMSSNGVHNGHRAFLKIDRDNKWGYVLVANLNSGANDMILQNLDLILQGKGANPPVLPIPNIIPDLNQNPAEFTGRYLREGNNEFEILVKNDSVWAGDIQLYPTQPDCFFEYRFYGNVCFKRDDSGKVKQVEWITPTFKSVGVKQSNR